MYQHWTLIREQIMLILPSIIAVHGLGGHREKSWTTENGVNWLESLLPVDLPETRIHTWGYASMYTDEPETPQDTSERLVSELFAMRKMTGVGPTDPRLHFGSKLTDADTFPSAHFHRP